MRGILFWQKNMRTGVSRYFSCHKHHYPHHRYHLIAIFTSCILPFGFVGTGVVAAVVDVFVVVTVAVVGTVVATVVFDVDVVVDAVVVADVSAVVASVVEVDSHWSKEGASLGPPTALHSACRVR